MASVPDFSGQSCQCQWLVLSLGTEGIIATAMYKKAPAHVPAFFMDKQVYDSAFL
jgi:hypothetical protein